MIKKDALRLTPLHVSGRPCRSCGRKGRFTLARQSMMRPHGSGVCAHWMPVVPMELLLMRPGVKPAEHATRRRRLWCKASYH